MGLTFGFGHQCPWTSGLSSSKSSVQHSALGLPLEVSSRKKLTPRSESDTMESSAMVNLPIPGQRGEWLASKSPMTRGHGLTNRVVQDS